MAAVEVAPEPAVASVPAPTDWAAILAGAILATAIGLVLLGFGAGLGLSVASPYEGEGMDASLFAIAAGIWFLWVQLVAFSAGGYAAGRLARRAPGATEHESDVRDGLHGLMVWAAGVVIAAVVSFAGLGGAAGTAAESGPIQAAVETAGEVIAERAAEDVAPTDAADQASSAGEATAQEENAAEAARRIGVIAAFVTAASLLAGAVAAFYAAGKGGKHRDRGTIVPFFTVR